MLYVHMDSSFNTDSHCFSDSKNESGLLWVNTHVANVENVVYLFIII